MTGILHRAILTSAAAGGLSLFFIFDHRSYNQGYRREQHRAYDYC